MVFFEMVLAFMLPIVLYIIGVTNIVATAILTVLLIWAAALDYLMLKLDITKIIYTEELEILKFLKKLMKIFELYDKAIFIKKEGAKIEGCG